MAARAALVLLTLVLLAGRGGRSQHPWRPTRPALSPTKPSSSTAFSPDPATLDAAEDGPRDQGTTQLAVNPASKGALPGNDTLSLVEIWKNSAADWTVRELNCAFPEDLACSSATTVKNFCGYRSDQHCSCDSLCMLNKDCCEDFPTACPVTHERAEAVMAQYAGVQAECMEESVSIVLSSCGQRASGLDLHQKVCSGELRGSSYLDTAPVWDKSSRLNFKNVHCALCNGAAKEDLVPWNVTILKSEQDVGLQSLQHFLNDVWTQQSLPGNMRWTSTEARFCEPLAKHECARETGGHLTDLCDSYMTSLVVEPSTKTVYRNKYCLACDGGEECKAVGRINKFHALSTVMTLKEKGETQIVNSNPRIGWGSGVCKLVEGQLTDCRIAQCKGDYDKIDGACVPRPRPLAFHLLLDFRGVTGLDQCRRERDDQFRNLRETTNLSSFYEEVDGSPWQTTLLSSTLETTTVVNDNNTEEGLAQCADPEAPEVSGNSSEENRECTLFRTLLLKAEESLQGIFTRCSVTSAQCKVRVESEHLLTLTFSHSLWNVMLEDALALLVEAAKTWIPAVLIEEKICGIVRSCMGLTEAGEETCEGNTPYLYTDVPCGASTSSPENGAAETSALGSPLLLLLALLQLLQLLPLLLHAAEEFN